LSEVIVVTSGKGGVGKTTTTANIGTALAMEGKRVVLLDADIGLRNLDLIMGLENRIVYDLTDVIDGTCRLQQALIKDKRHPHLFLLPAAQTKDKDAIGPEQMQKLCAALKEEFDYVIIDCPAGIEGGFKNAIAGADRAIVVTNPEISAVRDADRIVGFLEANDLRDPLLVLNRIDVDLVKRGIMMTLEDVSEILAIKLLGVVPNDETIVDSANRGDPAVSDEKSLAGAAFRDIGKRIMGEDIPFRDLDVNVDGFFAKLKKLFA